MTHPAFFIPTHRLIDLIDADSSSFQSKSLNPSHSLYEIIVCGRLMGAQTNETDFWIDDGTSMKRFLIPSNEPFLFSKGDWLALCLPQAQSGIIPQKIQLLQASQTGKMKEEYPVVDGDWYSFHQNNRQRFHNIEKRSALLREIRSFFEKNGFLEIEAPLLVPSPGLELHLQAMKIESMPFYLITSPEYQLKRLLCAGFQKMYSLGKVFRQSELGPHHNPEFTMLEWYRAFVGWQEIAKDVENLYAHVATYLTRSPIISYQGMLLDVTPPWSRMSVQEAVEKYAGMSIYGDESVGQLAEKIKKKGLVLPKPPWKWDDLFFSVFLDHVEPFLGKKEEKNGHAYPVILYDWPRPLCALARKKPGQEAVVERFEAYVGGLELCNGFGELCDPEEQRIRFLKDLQERKERNLPKYPVDEKFLKALEEGMPPSGGVALGVDRLMMLMLDAKEITEVLPFSMIEL